MRVYIPTAKKAGFWLMLDRQPQWTVREIVPYAGRVPYTYDLIGTTWPIYLKLKEELQSRAKTSTYVNYQEHFPVTVADVPQGILETLSADCSLEGATIWPKLNSGMAVVLGKGWSMDEGIKLPKGSWKWKVPVFEYD